MEGWFSYLPFRDQIAEVLDERLHPIEWLDAQVFAGLANVFVHDDSCLLTQFNTFPSGAKEIHGLVAVGDMNTIAHILTPRAEQFGREHGCIIASLASRPGWAKALDGYAPYQLTLRKDL